MTHLLISLRAVLLASLLATPAWAKPVFHFNFSDAAGKDVVTDPSSGFSCRSETSPFQVEKGALRIAPGARIVIPSEKLPDLSKKLTTSAWILKRSTPDVAPILSQGLDSEPGGFRFATAWRYPVFYYANAKGQTTWQGIYYDGYFGTSIKYGDTSWLRPDAKLVEAGGTWYQVAAVFDAGTVRVFVDGQPVATHKTGHPSHLQPSPSPLYVGAIWEHRNEGGEKGIVQPSVEADLLMNDLRLDDEALSDADIAALYESERGRYPAASQIPTGKTHTTALEPCYAYLGPEYDPDFQNVLKITAEHLAKMADKKIDSQLPMVARNALVGSIPGFTINKKPVYPLAIIPAPLNYATGGFMVREAAACVRDFAAAGVNLVGLDLIPSQFWKGEGDYDWEKMDDTFAKYLEGNPNAKLIVGLPLYPPEWFATRFPDDMEQYFHGGQLKTMRLAGPLGSDHWLKVSLQMISDLVSHVESGPYANHVFAYICGGGQSMEWYWPGCMDGPAGYSPATRLSFQNWAHAKYQGDITQLRDAWKTGLSDFSAVAPPPPETRLQSAQSAFLNPINDQWEIDFRQYLTDRTVENILTSAQAVKKASAGKKLVYTYYGYALSATGFPKLPNAGLQGLERVLDCPDVDSVAALIDYTKRRQGQAGLGIAPFHASAWLRGKFIWLENDTRTHLARGPFAAEKTRDAAETITVMERGFGAALTEGAGMWWRVFENDWFHQEEVMRTIATFSNAGEQALSKNRSSIAEVALVFDESVPYFLANAYQGFLREHVWGTYEAAARMGAPYDVLLLSDLGNPDTKDYKLYVFLNAWRSTPQTAQVIEQKIRKNNAVAVWTFAPGYLGNGTDTQERMKMLSGIRLAPMQMRGSATLKIVDRESPIVQDAHAAEMKSFEVSPAFYSDDPNAQTLATIQNKPALVVREFGSWRSVFSLMPLTREILQGLCHYAGVHLFHREADVFNANKTFLMLHTTTAGKKTIRLPEAATIREILTNKIVAKDSTEITEDLPANATRIYAIEGDK